MTGLGARLLRLRRPGRSPAPAPATHFDRRLILPMLFGSVLNPVNSSMLAVALVPIGVAFGAPPSRTVWLVSALYLATAVGQPVLGRLVDRYGPRRVYLAGTSLVGLAGLLGAVAPSLEVLIAARVLLGFGTCAAYPASMYLIRAEARRTGRDSPGGVLAALSVANQTVSVVGPTLGGLLIDVGGWRAIFTVNVPLSLACLVLGALRLPRGTPLADDAGKGADGTDADVRRPAGLDLAGMALFAALLTTLLLFVMTPRADLWYLPALGVAAGAGLVARESRIAEPFLDLRVLGGNLPLLATFLRQVLTYTTSYAFLYGETQWLEDGRGLSPSGAGLVLLPMFLSAITATALSARRRAVRGSLVLGASGQLVGCVLLLLVHAESPIWLLVTIALIVGAPQGLNGLANQNALYFQADPARMGSSAGLLRTFTYLGAMAAAAATAGFFGHRADTAGLHELAIFLIAVATLLLAVVLLDRSLGRIGRDGASGADVRS
ncbi:MFS transporter [Streptomyces sp. B6B3]|uniref:MFS transporter n=1 Tax=Streptomyces sp. B6B3 TaxID=3153570 RepID=UPI00325EA353